MSLRSVPVELNGYVYWWVKEDMDRREICIYGDPEGLRSLSESLNAIADLDQTRLANSQCPPDDSFHQHYGIPEGLPRSETLLTIGRVDEKASGKVRDCFPELREMI